MASSTLEQKSYSQRYPERKRFTVNDFHTMIEAGIFTEKDSLELINGEILKMTPIGTRHAACVRSLTYWLHQLIDDVSIDVQNPLQLNAQTETYPDLVILKHLPNAYTERIPDATDVLLLIEVSDSTLHFDRSVKLPQYAEAGVPEVWIIDLQKERVLVHRSPLDGVYGQVEEVTKDGVLSVEALVDAELKVADIL